ncbi:queuosine salvage protein, partial [Haematococcus lacustris]
MSQRLVLQTCEAVVRQATHVSINSSGLTKAAATVTETDLRRLSSLTSFDDQMHFVDRSSPEGQALTATALLVVDALNFCFWPEPGLEYEHLAKGVKAAVLADPNCLASGRLAQCQGKDVQALLGWPRPVPLQEERARLLREVGAGLLQHCGGSVTTLLESAQGSAVALVDRVTALFPGFRDHAVYRGAQVFFYKRAQIWVGDVYGALQGRGLAAFHDIAALTMFADYRVPVVLRVLGVLDYSPELEALVQARQQLMPGSEQEVEIRAATVVAPPAAWADSDTVGHASPAPRTLPPSNLQGTHGLPYGACTPDPSGGSTVPGGTPPSNGSCTEIKEMAGAKGNLPEESGSGGQASAGVEVLAITLDWWLWEWGERCRAEHPAHHRTLTCIGQKGSKCRTSVVRSASLKLDYTACGLGSDMEVAGRGGVHSGQQPAVGASQDTASQCP